MSELIYDMDVDKMILIVFVCIMDIGNGMISWVGFYYSIIY